MKLSSLLSAFTAAALFQVSAAKAVADDGCFHWNSQDDALFHPNDWKHCHRINDNLFMYYTPMEDTVMLGLHVVEDLYGWSSLAPAGNGGMKGASQIVVRKNDDDEWIAEDRYSMDYTTPSLDNQQDVQLLFAQQDEVTGETAWGVVIPVDSCDEPYDYPLEDHAIFMLWALGSTHDFSFHGSDRGQFTANLMGSPPSEADMEEYDHLNLVMPNVPMVRGEEDLDPTNPFICSYFDLDVLGKDMGFNYDDKIHMVGYKPVLTEGNDQYLHHMTMFSCHGYAQGATGFQQELDDSHLYHQKVIPSCTNMPPGCQEFLGGWAVGIPGVSYPPNVGIPIGEGRRWLVIQTHYYNPAMVKGVYDSSGLRAYVTKDLRPVDAGVMSFAAGVATGQHPPLPGGQKDVAMETLYVEPDCTMGWSGPLTVFGVKHHSHFMGSHQEIVVERNGVNLGPMRKEHVYDYKHQGVVEPSNAVRTLMPGDRLVASCHFDTTPVSENSTVQIGEESYKEMCFPSLLYYPKQEELNSFVYLPTSVYSPLYISDLEWCSQPSSEESFGSQCAEKLYTNVSGFSAIFSRIGYGGASFDYPTLCNGGLLTANVRDVVPGICPDNGCTETQNCSEEELRDWAKGVCEFNCGKFGLTLYPDLSRTGPYNTANLACPNAFFDAPILAELAACQAEGSLPQRIELTNAETLEYVATAPDDIYQDSSGSGVIVWKSFAVALCFFGFLLL